MRYIFLFFLYTSTFNTFSQGITATHAHLNYSESTTENDDHHILESANYIMSHPVNQLDQIRNDAMGTVLFWMMNTPKYTFLIDETIVHLIEKNEEILAIYMVAMTQFVLENQNYSDDTDKIKLQAFIRLLDYCDNPQNNINKSEAIIQAINALRTGWLKEYLKIS